jgi:glycosyltransferase involved in cell wall biosynthesis
MRLSIVMPSHRDDRKAISRIAQACSWAGPGVEVIVRDNSEKAHKRRLIEGFQAENFRLIFADECSAEVNSLAALDVAQGDFVFFIGDDDLFLDRGVAAMAAAAEKFADDASVSGIAGTWLTLHSRYGARHSAEQRQAIAARWFEVMFARFAGDNRGNFGSSLGPQADLLCQKWRGLYPNFDLQVLLADICDFIALHSPEKAGLYRDFWQGLASVPAP